MYPRLSDLFQDLFGIDLPLPIYSFGFMVAVAIVTAAWLTKREFDRMYRAGQLSAVSYKERDAKGRDKVVKGSPSAIVWTLMLLAAGFGIAGSKLFYLIEQPGRFIADPIGTILSPAGLTFYGGLICAGLAIAYYVGKKKGLNVPRVADAIAPGLILGYGIGRIGCYLAGDGDWGKCSSLSQKPAWIPDFLWSETFPRNILGVDVKTWSPEGRVSQCDLPQEMVTGVYPTMLYEFGMAVVIFGILWVLRKHPFKAGWLFSLYLVFNGVERYLIETVRLNPVVIAEQSQAQLIAILLVILGAVGLALTTRKATGTPTSGEATPASVTA